MQSRTGKKSLVTGGAGFIGSHLVERLLSDGHDVVVIDNMASGRPDNLAHLARHPGLQVVTEDITRQAEIAPHFAGVDWVFHVAAMADIVPSIQQPAVYHASNVIGTFSVLECARAAGVKRFVYAASSSCYGIPDSYPTPETAELRPQYPYALTKMVGEQYVMHWAQVYGLPAVSLRFFNVFGPRHRTSGTYGAVFGVFLAQKLANKPFTVVGDGTQTRDFTYVTDVVDALVTAAGSNLTAEIMNVGSGGTYSVNELVALLGGPVTYIPKRPGEPDCTFADTTKIRRLLDWKPRTTFAEGVRLLLNEIESFRTAPVWDADSIAVATRDWFRYLGTDETAKGGVK
jgi:UDP-glucose 4-epimerase